MMFLLVPLATSSFARDEVKGIVYRVSSSEITLEVKQRDTRHFSIDKGTRAFIMGQPYPVTRIMTGSIARVVREKGKVTAIFVEEAPK
jgi:hypothetical protein